MNTSPVELLRQKAAEMKPIYSFDDVTDLSAHREKCEEKLKELLGMDSFTKCDPDVTITEDTVTDGIRNIHFMVQTEAGYYVNCHFMLPAAAEGPLPLCVCLQGHSKGAHISLGIIKYPGDENSINNGDRDFAVRAVKEGFCALAIEQRAFGENGGGKENGPQCDYSSKVAMILGRTIIGERVWDVSRILDVVESRFSDITTLEGSVCMGNSGGGTATYYIACLEHRFTAYMPSCAVCNYRDSIIAMKHCICNYIPGIARYFEMGDLAVMIAPKKLVVVSGLHDDFCFPIHGAKAAFETIQKCYAAAGVPENCVQIIGEEGHRFYADAAWPVMHKMLAR